MRMKEKLLVPLLLSFSVFISQQASGQTELKNLIGYALEHSHDVKKAEYQLQESSYMVKEARGHGLPQVEGSASSSKMMFKNIEIPASAYSMIPAEYSPILDKLSSIDKFYSTSAAVQVTQLIYSQSYWIGLNAAKKTRELYFILKTKSEEEIIAEVADGYYQAGSLMLQVQTINKSIKNLKEIFRIVDLNYKNDFIKESDVNRLKVTITNLETTQKTLQNGIYIQMNYLKALAGIPSDSTISIDAESLVNNFDIRTSKANFKIEDVPSYQALTKQAEVYEQQTKLSKAEYYPTLAAFGKYSFTSGGTSFNLDSWNKMSTIGLNLSIPIFKSGVTRSKVRRSQLQHFQLNEDITKSKELLKIAFDNAQSAYQTAQEQLIVQKDNRELAQKVYQQTLLQYQEGMASMADLLNVNSDFLQADNSYNQQVLKCKTSEIQMLKASGNLKSLVSQKQ